MTAYYNEVDPYAAQWLRNLIAAGHIAPGEVDERSIVDVKADDLVGYTQCHFFAGIAVWSYALRRLAGWPDDRPVWTGSCPCQPFSAAGKQSGMSDERHLWPVWFDLIRQCHPRVVFGEQVEAAIRHGWLDLVQTDMEGIGYAFAPVGIPAAGFGAPHIRQRLWFVADAASNRHDGRRHGSESDGRNAPRIELAGLCDVERVAHADSGATGRDAGTVCGAEGSGASSWDSDGRNADGLGNGSDACDLANPTPGGLGIDGSAPGSTGHAALGVTVGGAGNSEPLRSQGRSRTGSGEGMAVPGAQPARAGAVERPGPTNGLWRDADWIFCRDGKWRAVEPGTFPLVNGASSRVGRLRAYGNAIVPQVAAEFIRAYLDT